jgi:uncharacterized protein involved in outer membrane biogenesis
MKKILKIAAGIIFLVAIVSAGTWFFLDAIVQRTIEKRGSQELGVAVKVDQADLAVLDGEFMLAGLQIENPEGYKGRLFEMNGARTAMQPATLFKDEIVVDSLVIDSPSLNIEYTFNGTNLAKVLSRIDSGTVPVDQKQKQRTYQIRQIEINGAKVTMDSSVGAELPVTLTLPDIVMENVSSSDGKGLTLAQVFEKVAVKMTATAIRTGKTEIPPVMLLDVSTDLKQYAPELEIKISEKAQGILEKAQGILMDLLKGGEQETNK